jgi:hypothetical protein
MSQSPISRRAESDPVLRLRHPAGASSVISAALDKWIVVARVAEHRCEVQVVRVGPREKQHYD